MDIYFETEEELQSAIICIKEDKIYDSRRTVDDAGNFQNNNNNALPPVLGAEEPGSRRAELLARRTQVVVQEAGEETFEEKLDEEITR